MTNDKTATAQEKLQELHAKIDAAMCAKDTPPYTAAQLRKEAITFCGLQGDEAGQILNRLDDLKAKEALDAQARIRLKDVTNNVDYLLAAISASNAEDSLPPAAFALNRAGSQLLNADPSSFEYRAGALLTLTSFLLAPDVLPQVLQNLRSALLDADPQLAPLAGDVTPLEHTPLAVNHTIDGLHLDMLPDGSLEISGVTDGPGRFEPADAYALGVFLRLPAVVALLEAQNAVRQTEQEGEQEASMAEEAARMAAR